MDEVYAIIVAGGSGSRMGTSIPKQFLDLAGKPIIIRTLEKFLEIKNIKIIVVINGDYFSFAQNEFSKHNLSDIKLVKGGNSRFQSVRNGLNAIQSSTGVVLIHDAVRPFVSIEIIRNSITMTLDKGNAITAVKAKDSIRQIDHSSGHSTMLNRSDIMLVQTPQTFQLEVIKRGFLQEECTSFTDDASVVEKNGEIINLIDGDYKNIKITTPEDLIIAQALI